MRRLIATLAILVIALPASATVTAEADTATVTNDGTEAATYLIQVYEGAAEKTLAPGESYTFGTVGRGGPDVTEAPQWAVWSNGELLASGQFVHVRNQDEELVLPEPTPAPRIIDVDADTYREHVAEYGSASVYPI